MKVNFYKKIKNKSCKIIKFNKRIISATIKNNEIINYS